MQGWSFHQRLHIFIETKTKTKTKTETETETVLEIATKIELAI